MEKNRAENLIKYEKEKNEILNQESIKQKEIEVEENTSQGKLITKKWWQFWKK